MKNNSLKLIKIGVRGIELNDRIGLFIKSAYLSFKDVKFDEKYQKIFADEGKRKAQYIIDFLRTIEKKEEILLQQFGYLCIGGADGSEIEEIFRNTPIRHAVLIEISEAAASDARHRSLQFKKEGRELVVVQGDATQMLDTALSHFKKWKNMGLVDGLICSCQAVLHELPSRSPNFDFPVFFGKLFKTFNNNFFVGREPIIPERWPKIVEICIPGVNGDNLKAFASLVNDKLKLGCTKIEALANNYVMLPSLLAIEVLHKLLRCGSTQEFSHEINEQLTSFDPSYVQQLINKDLGEISTKIEPFCTEGFEDAYKYYEVSTRTTDGTPLPIPHTHARIIAYSIDSARCNPLNTKTLDSYSNQIASMEVSTGPRFVHRKIPGQTFICLNSGSNPYCPLFDATDPYPAEKPSTIYSYFWFPKSQYLSGSLINQFTPAAAICTTNPVAVIDTFLKIVDPSNLEHILKPPSKLHHEIKSTFISTISEALARSFCVAVVFPKLLLTAAKKKPELGYQVMVNMLMLPLMQKHKHLDFRKFYIRIPDVGSESKSLIKISKKAANACFHKKGTNTVELTKDTRYGLVIEQMAWFVAWAVSCHYNGTDKKGWLTRLEKALNYKKVGFS